MFGYSFLFLRAPLIRRLKLGTFLLLAALSGVPAAAAAELLSADQAFRLEAEAQEDGALRITFRIAAGTYLYRERFSVSALDSGVQLGQAQLPRGVIKHDPTFDRDMEIYYDELTARLRVTAAQAQVAYLRIGYQGCADIGVCYPPQTQYLRIKLAAGGRVLGVTEASQAEAQAGSPASAAVQSVPAQTRLQPAVRPAASQPVRATPVIEPLSTATSTFTSTAASTAASAAPARLSASQRVDAALQSRSLTSIAAVFAVAGLLLSLTPCVLPMLPILSSIIVGHGTRVSRGRSVALACSYSLGMAMVYTAFGIAAAWLGQGLAASLQTPLVLGSFAVLLVVLSLSMFGAYSLQLPAAWQAGISQASGRLRAGSLFGVFMMGGLSALIVSPCVAAPLATALVYISQTGEMWIGAVALFCLAAGMSVPLLLLGLSAGALLPRAGPWMEAVKTFFGVLLLGLAWWLLRPILTPMLDLFLLGVWFALGAAFTGAFDTLSATASLKHRALKALGWVLALLATLQIVGAMLGADSPLQPLKPLSARAAADVGALPFRRINSAAELDAALAQAQGRPVMLDFYADWCIACKEMEHQTFSDPAVRARLQAVVLLQADVTANRAEHQALLQRFGLFGPPAILFFDAQGHEQTRARVLGFQNAADFLTSLEAVRP